MSTVKISDLPEVTHLSTDTTQTIIPVVDIIDNATYKITAKTLAEGLYHNDALKVGENEILFSNTIGQFSGNGTPFLQVNLQNFDSNSSGDYVVTADIGTNANNFIDVGINGSTFTDPTYSAMQALDGYLYVSGSLDHSTNGNLVIGTASSGANVLIAPGGTTTENVVAHFTKNGLVFQNSATLEFADASIQTVAAAPANYTQSAFDAANTASANTVIIQGVNVTQNTNITAVNNYAASAYAAANTNATNISIMQGVNTTQNTNITAVNGFAAGAFAKANNALANTTGTFAGDLTIAGNTTIRGFVDVFDSSFPTNQALIQITASDNGATVAPSNTNYMLQLTGKANSATRFVMDSFGENTYPAIIGRVGRGSAAAPSATSNNDVLMRIAGNGYTGTQFPSSGPNKIDFVATENFTDTSRGTAIQFWNTPNGSNTIQKIASFNANEVTFTGTVNPGKGFIYTPLVYPSSQTAITIDFSNGPLVRAQTSSGLVVTLSNHVAGKAIELWVTNTAGSTQTFTHGVSAVNSTVGSTSYNMPGGSTISARYVCLDGTLANTMCAITHA